MSTAFLFYLARDDYTIKRTVPITSLLYDNILIFILMNSTCRYEVRLNSYHGF